MKIIHITHHHVFLGGGERLIDNWLRNSRHEGVFYARAGGIDYPNKDFKTYADEAELEDLLKQRGKQDIVIVHDPFIGEQKFLNDIKRKLWYVHGAFAFTMDLTRYPKPLFAISNFQPKARHRSWQNIFVAAVHLGVDTNLYQPSGKQRTGKFIIGIVGRVSEEKCPLYFFDFIDKFNIEHPDHNFEFHYYGKTVVDSEFDIKFKARAAKTLRFRYMGYVDKDDANKLYHKFDCLIVPSLSESGSFAILEAQASGLRVFALNADGIPYHMAAHSALCKDYDDIFARLARFTRKEAAIIAPKIRAEMIAEFGLQAWVYKLDLLAEMASFI